jgi:hypothetical protein
VEVLWNSLAKTIPSSAIGIHPHFGNFIWSSIGRRHPGHRGISEIILSKALIFWASGLGARQDRENSSNDNTFWVRLAAIE